jgi:transcriptional regulator GlxA family with amidase domain
MEKRQWTVGILLFDHVDLTDLAGPYEVFHNTGYTRQDVQTILLGQDSSAHHPFLVRTVSQTGQQLRASNGLRLHPDYAFEQAPAFDIVVVPGASFETIAQVITHDEVIGWMTHAFSRAELVTSVCTGAFLLAQTALLNGKRATTHWAALDVFEQQFPQVQVQRTGKFVDEGTIITAAGVTSGFNMALHVVERLLGEKVAQATARAIDFQTAPIRA